MANKYKVRIWKTVVLEVEIDAENADAASAEAMDNFDDGDYHFKWDDAETTKVQALCDESDLVAGTGT